MQSSIMAVFPRWAAALGLGDCAINGIDLPLGAPAEEQYRAVVAAIRDDPMSRGALVTAHKIDLMHAAGGLFDDLDPHAASMGCAGSMRASAAGCRWTTSWRRTRAATTPCWTRCPKAR